MNQKVYSFDIFDTCIVRNVARPTDLFYKLYSQTKINFPAVYTHEVSSELAHDRILSEAKARSDYKDKEDILINEFYQYLEKLAKWGVETNSLLAAEIELELRSVRPILATKNRIEQLRQERQRIIFISDMYLPTKVIQKMLLDCNLALPEEPIYVSGDIGLTKSTGSLFKYVLAQESLTPQQLHHHGDNIHSDVIVPRALGISASYFSASQLNRYEAQVVTRSHAPLLVRSQIAGVSRAIRLMKTDAIKISPALASLASNIIAPLLVSYVTWVIQDAQQQGIENLCFISNKGKLLWEIAQLLGKFMAIPDCHYLDVSQQDNFLASLTRLELSSTVNWATVDLDWNFEHQRSLRNLLSQLEFNHPVTGYSWGVFNNCRTNAEVNDYRAFLIQDTWATHPSAIQTIFRHHSIIEQLLAASVFSLPLHQLIFDYAQEISQTNILDRDLEELKTYALTNAVKLLANPTQKEVIAIAQLNPSQLPPLVRQLGIRELTYFATRLTRRVTKQDKSAGLNWRAGAIAISHPLIRLAYLGYKTAKQYFSPLKLSWIYQLRLKLRLLKFKKKVS